jgi:hypothetical protein
MLSAARAEPRDASASRNIPKMPISATLHQGVPPKICFQPMLRAAERRRFSIISESVDRHGVEQAF